MPQLHHAAHLTQLALEANSAGVVVTDSSPERRVEYCNPPFARLVGEGPQAVRGRPLRALLETATEAEVGRSGTLVFCSGPAGAGGRTFNVSPVRAGGGEVTHYLWVQVENVTPPAAPLERDPRTGLPQRDFFMRELENTAVRCQFDMNAAVGFLRLDDLQASEPLGLGALSPAALGPEARNELLSHLVARLRSCVRTSDVIAALRPKEFGLLLLGVHDEASLQIVRERMNAALHQPFVVGRAEVRLTASFAFILPDWDSQRPQDILQQAQGSVEHRGAVRAAAPSPAGPTAAVPLAAPAAPARKPQAAEVAVTREGRTVSIHVPWKGEAPPAPLELSDTEAFFLLLFLQHAPAGRSLRLRSVRVSREDETATLQSETGEARVPLQDLLVRLHNGGFPGTQRPLLKRASLVDTPGLRAEAREGLALTAPGIRLLLDAGDARILQVALLLGAARPVRVEYHAATYPIARFGYDGAALHLQLPAPHPTEEGTFTWSPGLALSAGQRYSLSEQLLQAANKALYQQSARRETPSQG